VIHFAEEALADLEQIFNVNFDRDPITTLHHVDKIRTAIIVLEQHPEIGRPIRSRSKRGDIQPRPMLRELIVSHGNTGYVGLYEYSPVEKLIRVVAVRPQREAGYRGR
jgi:plasmid stabilization system protein ParE